MMWEIMGGDFWKGLVLGISATGLVFLIFLAVAFLSPEVPKPSGTAEVPEVPKPLVTTEVAVRGGFTSMGVTVEGEKDSFDLILIDPEKDKVGEGHISSSDMSDGRETVWLSMADYHTQANAGTYTLVIEGSMGDSVYEGGFVYSGPDLEIERVSSEFSYGKWWGYYVESPSVTVRNDGDLPAYVTHIEVSIAEEERTVQHFAVIPAGETMTLREEDLAVGPIEEGFYRATYRLNNYRVGRGSVTLATYSAIVRVPGV